MFLLNETLQEKQKTKPASLEHSTYFDFSQLLPDAVLSLLNLPIYMQVGEQLDVGQLSFWFLFHKQYVRDDGGDGEQSYFIIKFPLYWNTKLILETLLMHLSVKFWIKNLHYSSPAILAQNLCGEKTKPIMFCLIGAICLKWSGLNAPFWVQKNKSVTKLAWNTYKFFIKVCDWWKERWKNV